ncbi:general secretion pathway protein GspB [Aestuariibacter halophilus]|uniref:General secretion pathway protein GspB n=1 Tax=Fluctibacter halophilus TaxID=226011 RepID=A0ABS8G883_9ALTE|nr:general secretion pathway protein GspB [Aestuariibacter halophilus]MCC2616638.1 general secretion pathway protein GspB [Aestuariibacter halophilus]
MRERKHIDALSPGMVIVQITEQNGPVTIKKSGLISSQDMINGLREMGVVEVEIDTAQTVEIASTPANLSATAQLLKQGDKGPARDPDGHDHINRSLFLTTADELPTPLRFYAKPVLQALVVLLLGGAIGFGGARWLHQPIEVDSLLAQQSAPMTKPLQQPAQQPAASPTNSIASQASAPAQPAVENNSALVESDTAQQNQAAMVMSNELQADSASPQQASEPEGRVLNAPAQQPDSEQLSPELLRRFEAAVQSLDNDAPPSYEPEVKRITDRPRVHELPAQVLTQLPSMAFTAHMYASDADDRWVRINGKRYHEGEMIERELQLLRIEPQEVILAFRGQEFSMAALTDW